MLTFFRKIRKGLLGSGQARRYLVYAIGEIALVVIGILIALQINNWNEERKSNISELLALIDLKDEFEDNQQRFDSLSRFKIEMSLIWESYLKMISNPNLTLNEKTINRPPMASRRYTISNSKLNSLLNSGNIDNISNDSLKYLLTRWNNIMKSYGELESLQELWVNEHILPYESTIMPLPRNTRSEIIENFYTHKEIMKFRSKALGDLTYRNYLIRNFHLLKLQVESIEELQNNFSMIINLLVREIAIKKGG